MTEIANELAGTYKSNQNEDKSITIDISDFKSQNTDIAVVTKELDIEKVLIPEFQIINGILTFSLTPEAFYSNFLLFMFYTTDYSSFEIFKIHLIDIDRSSDPNGTKSSQSFAGFVFPVLIFSLSSFVALNLIFKKNRQ
jgi:hypothetical protein